MTKEQERLEYLRGQIQAECISYCEIAELQGLVPHIDPSDVELLEWAGVPEFDTAGGIEGQITLVGETEREDGWKCREWDVELAYQGRTMTTKFYTGMLLGEPTVDDVVGSLVSDALGVEYDGFEDWAANYGMDTDSRKALVMYEGVVEQTERFKDLCGDDFDNTVTHYEEA